MDFHLTEDQHLLVDAVARYLAREYPFDAHARRTTAAGQHWHAFAELGLLGLPFEERYGGGGGSAIDVALVMQEFGKALVTEPYLATVILAGTVLDRAGSLEQKESLIPQMIAGRLRVALAWEETHTASDLSRIETRYHEDGEGYCLDGYKKSVLAGVADQLIVLARKANASTAGEHYRLFLVPADAHGLGVISYPSLDGSAVSGYSLDSVRIPRTALLGDGGCALRHVEHALDLARVALCAEAVGIMEAVVRDTAEYARNRRQFGAAISSFQALQHKMVDMLVHTEQAKSSMWRALGSIADDTRRGQACAAAKAMAGIGARFVGQQAVQIHGGMGMTNEMKISHYFRRLTAIEQTLGNAAHHLHGLALRISRAARG
ncbi:Acyl-CoA dehydrogenase [Cupriavidus necator]|uniref:Acyl-CoA dehydrogenase n=1 Tax=Cupriavidus necator TaxID=106590 RepID=A0A1K0JFH6_CUPNE|nr:Acyl-CoA dehydrogenase [Cupriavidus necator]